jgi:DNA-binding NarL/FixJ family response regulator
MNTLARAILVDDDPNWQHILREILEDMGLEVEVASSLAQAQKIGAGPHRLAVLDLCLEESDHHNQDGIRVADAIRARDPDCIIIMLTGHATVELAVSVLTEHGVSNCLRKEVFHRSEFKKMIQRSLEMAPSQAAAVQRTVRATTALPESKVTAAKPLAEVLIVEDDTGWRAILQEILIDAGFRTRVSTSFGDALGALRRGKYSLAIVDLSLAGPAEERIMRADPNGTDLTDLEGYRLLTSIQSAGVPVIVLSGLSDPESIERAYRERRIFAFLEKQNFERKVFLQTVRDVQAAAVVPSELDVLTEREREVLDLVAKGKTNKEIADALVITTNTVKRHLKAVFTKLDIHTRSAAAAKIANVGGSG